MGRENHWAHISAPINEDMLSDIIDLYQHLEACNKGNSVTAAHELLLGIKEKYQETESWIEAN